MEAATTTNAESLDSPASSPPREQPAAAVTEIRPTSGWAPLKLGELWQFRQLIYFFTWRDLKVRYKQTVLGAAWAILQPLLTMLVFTFFFGHLAKIGSDGSPYAVWSFCGLLPWQYFTFVVTQSANSMVANQNLLKKVYFPRLTIPLSLSLVGLVDFAIALVMLVVLMAFFAIAPTVNVLLVVPFILLAMMVGLGVGLWSSALNVRFRDVRYTIPFLVQLWLFVSPVAYPTSLVPQSYDVAGLTLPLRAIYSLNPLVGVIEGFRWAILGTDAVLGWPLVISLMTSALLFVSGLYYFRNQERQFADIV